MFQEYQSHLIVAQDLVAGLQSESGFLLREEQFCEEQSVWYLDTVAAYVCAWLEAHEQFLRFPRAASLHIAVYLLQYPAWSPCQ